jgi:hypothetical protein
MGTFALRHMAVRTQIYHYIIAHGLRFPIISINDSSVPFRAFFTAILSTLKGVSKPGSTSRFDYTEDLFVAVEVLRTADVDDQHR